MICKSLYGCVFALILCFYRYQELTYTDSSRYSFCSASSSALSQSQRSSKLTNERPALRSDCCFRISVASLPHPACCMFVEQPNFTINWHSLIYIECLLCDLDFVTPFLEWNSNDPYLNSGPFPTVAESENVQYFPIQNISVL